jgi:hypothetical protein
MRSEIRRGRSEDTYYIDGENFAYCASCVPWGEDSGRRFMVALFVQCYAPVFGIQLYKKNKGYNNAYNPEKKMDTFFERSSIKIIIVLSRTGKSLSNG